MMPLPSKISRKMTARITQDRKCGRKQTVWIDFFRCLPLASYPLPCFVLQPLVENAIDHGLRDSRNPDKRLEISLFRRVDCYCIAIRDNGLGIEPERMENLFCLETGHIGVKNVYERLKLFYGTEDVLRIDSVLQQYTLVTIKIPIRPEENRNASPGAAPEKGKESSL